MDEFKLKPAFIEIYPRLKPNIEETAKHIVKANPDALIIVSSGKNTVNVIKAIRAHGGLMQIMTLSNNASRDFIHDLGADGVGQIGSASCRERVCQYV